MDTVRVVKKGETQLVAMSIYVSTGFVVYWLLFLLLPLIYLIHQAIKERVDSANAVFEAEIVSATFLVNLERPLEKFVVLIVIGVSMYIAEEVVVQERNAEVQVLKPRIRRVDYSRSKPATQRQKTFQSIIEEILEEEGHSEHTMEVRLKFVEIKNQFS
ncbi:hypothetical protein Pfo_022122 [Paulownia fortunei]|nr:hypothetical protein Pfo_022122 [Paulownia fortunei]